MDIISKFYLKVHIWAKYSNKNGIKLADKVFRSCQEEGNKKETGVGQNCFQDQPVSLVYEISNHI